jgi:hypothetical protein
MPSITSPKHSPKDKQSLFSDGLHRKDRQSPTTLNKLESCLNRTWNKVGNLCSFINQKPVYSEHKSWSQWRFV